MPEVEVINTTISARHRTISQLLDSGVTARYALIRRPNGDVHWAHDTFTREDVGGPLQWASHGGRLTVGEVLAHVPGARREIVRWTTQELEDGPDVLEVDIFSREVRRKALERLHAELGVVESWAS